MKEAFEAIYHEVEDRHWWFAARRECVLKMTKKLDRNSEILDIGCSSGLMLNTLIESGFASERMHGIDISEKAIANCKKAGLSQTHVMDAAQIDLPKQHFDLLIASDCLEHLEHDETALAQWLKLLKPNGKLIVFVPAYQFLWSSHDEVNLHFRRYTNRDLRQKLKKQGFKVQRSGYWNSFLLPPLAIVRPLGRMLGRGKSSESGDLKMPSPLVNRLLTALLRMENRMISWMRFPAGVSTFCIAERSQ